MMWPTMRCSFGTNASPSGRVLATDHTNTGTSAAIVTFTSPYSVTVMAVTGFPCSSKNMMAEGAVTFSTRKESTVASCASLWYAVTV